MNLIVDLALPLVAGVCLFASVTHFLVWLNQRSEQAHASFALLTLIAFLYVLNQRSVYQASTVDEYLDAYWRLGILVILFLATFPWFTTSYTRVRVRGVLPALTAIYGILGLAHFITPSGLTFTSIGGVGTHLLPWGEGVAFPIEPKVNAAWEVANVAAYFGCMFALFQCWRQWRREDRVEALLLASSVSLLMAGVVTTVLREYSLWRSITAAEFCFVAFVVIMSVGLSRQLRRLEIERRQLEDQLRQAQKLEAVGTLAAGVAHDIRNVLTVILGGVELAEMHRSNPSKLLKTLGDVRNAAYECAAVAQALVTFSRREQTTKSILNVAEIVRNAVPLLKRVLPDSVEIVTDIRDEALYISGNRPQLDQVLLNLAVNARDAMPRGGVLKIDVEVQRPGTLKTRSPAESSAESVVIFVQDSGTGMSDDVRDRAFEPFFTTKSRERGTGLGLAIVHGIVNDHEGNIEIDTEVDRGTRFKITFPLREGVESGSEGQEPQPHRSQGKGETILLVEDNQLVRATLGEVLDAGGYQVLQAGDSDEALRVFAANSGSVRLLISDLDLPKADGASVIRTVHETCPQLPVIMITGSDERQFNPVDLQYATTLQKPFTMAELGTAVVQLLAEKQDK